jgi:hypothetical protein
MEEGVDESWQEQPDVPLWNSQPQWVTTSESVLLRVFACLLMCGKWTEVVIRCRVGQTGMKVGRRTD